MTMKRRVPILVLVAFVGLLAGCATLPPPTDRSPSQALTDTARTRLGQAVAPRVAEHPGLSGFMPFEDPHDAFAARVLLARAAERSLDVQYYIWHGDATGTLLWEALWQAAERGVRVRLLVDDANNAGLDPTLAALDAHPNIELRLYNPFVNRGFARSATSPTSRALNRRMHNKSFTADNQVSVVGGRNIADEYFGAAEGRGLRRPGRDGHRPGGAGSFARVRPVLEQRFRLPGRALRRAATRRPGGGAATTFRGCAAGPTRRAVPGGGARRRRLSGTARAPVGVRLDHRRVLHDDPAKTLDAEARSDLLLLPAEASAWASPQKRLDIISPYFVPGAVAPTAGRDVPARRARCAC